MSYGIVKVFTVTMASAGTLSSECYLGKSWGNAYLEIKSMNSNTQHHIQAAAAASSSGGVYRRVKLVPVSATVQTTDWYVASAASSAFVPLPAGLQYLKIEKAATVDNGATYSIVCSDQ